MFLCVLRDAISLGVGESAKPLTKTQPDESAHCSRQVSTDNQHRPELVAILQDSTSVLCHLCTFSITSQNWVEAALHDCSGWWDCTRKTQNDTHKHHQSTWRWSSLFASAAISVAQRPPRCSFRWGKFDGCINPLPLLLISSSAAAHRCPIPVLIPIAALPTHHDNNICTGRNMYYWVSDAPVFTSNKHILGWLFIIFLCFYTGWQIAMMICSTDILIT